MSLRFLPRSLNLLKFQFRQSLGFKLVLLTDLSSDRLNKRNSSMFRLDLFGNELRRRRVKYKLRRNELNNSDVRADYVRVTQSRPGKVLPTEPAVRHRAFAPTDTLLLELSNKTQWLLSCVQHKQRKKKKLRINADTYSASTSPGDNWLHFPRREKN